MSEQSETKRTKCEEQVETFKRITDLTGDEMDHLTIPLALRTGQTKQTFFASLTPEAKDKIQAEAFRFLMKELKETANGGELYVYLYELVQDVYDMDDYSWLKKEQ